MITMDNFHKARALGHLGNNKTKIAEELGIDRKTVRKYLESSTPPRYSPRKQPSRADPFAEFEPMVRHYLEKAPKLSGAEVYALIRPRGYQGSERTIERRMKRWRDEKPKERFFEQEYKPGEQSQFDFKESVSLPFKEGEKVAHLHFGTLPFSNAFFIHGYPQKTYECFMDGVHSFFEKIGGQTENIRFDNLTPCVKRILPSGKRLYTTAFERALEYYGVGALPCAPGKGSDKGDVERDIRTWAVRFCNHVKVHGLVFRDFAHLNEELAEFCARESAGNERLALERKHLKPVVHRDEGVLCRVEETRASSHGTVRINKTSYSVPDEWIDVWCRAVMGPFDVRINRIGYPNDVVVHPRKPEGEHSIKLEHVVKSLLRKPQAMIRWAHREILFPEPVFKALYRRLQDKEEGPGFAEREFLRVVNLIHHAPLTDIKVAIDIALGAETKAQNLFTEIKELLLTERRPQATVIEFHCASQIPLNPNLNNYDQLIPTALP